MEEIVPENGIKQENGPKIFCCDGLIHVKQEKEEMVTSDDGAKDSLDEIEEISQCGPKAKMEKILKKHKPHQCPHCDYKAPESSFLKSHIMARHTGMDWSNEQTLLFIKLYEKKSVLWDPKHPKHKNRMKVKDAWLQLQREFDASIPIPELKKKKESLMSSYRPLRRKVVESEGSGAEVFKPSWYAFEAIDRFMRAKGEKGTSINSEDGWIRETQPDEEDMSSMPDGDFVSISSGNTQADSNPFMKPGETKPFNTKFRHKRRRGLPPHSDIGIASSLKEASQALTILSSRQPCLDQCSIFGQLVAEQLRQLNPRNRILTQSKLSSILEKALLEELEHPPLTPLSHHLGSPANSSCSTVPSPSMFSPEPQVHK